MNIYFYKLHIGFETDDTDMSRAKRSPYEQPSEPDASSESEAESEPESEASEEETVATLPVTLREIPEALQKRYGGRQRRSMLFLQAYEHGWDNAYKASKSADMIKYLEGKDVPPIPGPAPTEKQKLHMSRMREFTKRMREAKLDKGPRKHIPRGLLPEKLDKRLTKLLAQVTKVKECIPNRTPVREALRSKRQAIYQTVVEDVTEPIEPPTKPDPPEELASPLKRTRKAKKPKKMIRWENTPSVVPTEATAAPTEATSLDLGSDEEFLVQYK